MSEEIITDNHWLVITNPTSGKRKFQEQSKYVLSELDKAQIPYFFKLTEYSGHAIEIAKYYAKRGCINYLVLGGDGSINEIINGIFAAEPDDTSDIKIALIPRGTGNDWGRFWGLKKNNKESMKIFHKGNCKMIDIGKVELISENNLSENHYFINSVGFGLDAKVVEVTHRMKKFMGSFSLLYTLALLSAVFKYKSTQAELTMDGKTQQFKLFTMNIANGPFSGGGIKQNPFALPYDGIFDMIVVEKPTIKDILTALPLIFNGKITQHPIIQSSQAREVTIKTEKNILMEADGIIVPNGHNCRVSIIPEAIQMIVP